MKFEVTDQKMMDKGGDKAMRALHHRRIYTQSTSQRPGRHGRVGYSTVRLGRVHYCTVWCGTVRYTLTCSLISRIQRCNAACLVVSSYPLGLASAHIAVRRSILAQGMYCCAVSKRSITHQQANVHVKSAICQGRQEARQAARHAARQAGRQPGRQAGSQAVRHPGKAIFIFSRSCNIIHHVL